MKVLKTKKIIASTVLEINGNSFDWRHGPTFNNLKIEDFLFNLSFADKREGERKRERSSQTFEAVNRKYKSRKTSPLSPKQKRNI